MCLLYLGTNTGAFLRKNGFELLGNERAEHGTNKAKCYCPT
jgi:hypothetical protein